MSPDTLGPLAARPLEEGFADVGDARLYFGSLGQGPPLIVLHGGPEFDHTYLRPGMDFLAGAFRLIYYDQRGRGRSTGSFDDISLESESADLDALRRHLGLETVALLGHSWGALPAMEYAARYPQHVSHLVLMNSAPASYRENLAMRDERRRRCADELPKLKEITSSPAYQAGDPKALTDYCQLLFRTAVNNPEHLKLLNLAFESFTKEGVLRARAIEEKLYETTFSCPGFDMTPRLQSIAAPTLVIHGDSDFIPTECATRIAQSIPGARLDILQDCAHFAFVEAPENVRQLLTDFVSSISS